MSSRQKQIRIVTLDVKNGVPKARSYLTLKDWEPYKEEILSLRAQKVPLSEIRRVMVEKYGFNASESQYKAVVGKWKSRQYLTADDHRYIVQQIKRDPKKVPRFRSRSDLEYLEENRILRIWKKHNGEAAMHAEINLDELTVVAISPPASGTEDVSSGTRDVAAEIPVAPQIEPESPHVMDVDSVDLGGGAVMEAELAELGVGESMEDAAVEAAPALAATDYTGLSFSIYIYIDMSTEEVDGFVEDIFDFLGIPVEPTSGEDIMAVDDNTEISGLEDQGGLLKPLPHGTSDKPVLDSEVRIENQRREDLEDLSPGQDVEPPSKSWLQAMAEDDNDSNDSSYLKIDSDAIHFSDLGSYRLRDVYPFTLKDLRQPELYDSKALKKAQLLTLRAQLLYARGQYYECLEFLSKAVVSLRQELAPQITNEGPGPQHIWVLRLQYLFATASMRLGQTLKARMILAGIVDDFSELMGAKHLETRDCFSALGDALAHQDLCLEAHDAYLSALPMDVNEVFKAVSNRGYTHEDMESNALRSLRLAVTCYSAAQAVDIDPSTARKYLVLNEKLSHGDALVAHLLRKQIGKRLSVEEGQEKQAFSNLQISKRHLENCEELNFSPYQREANTEIDFAMARAAQRMFDYDSADEIIASVISTGRHTMKGYEAAFVQLAWFMAAWNRMRFVMTPAVYTNTASLTFARSLKYFRWTMERSAELYGLRSEAVVGVADGLRKLLAERGLVRYSQLLGDYVTRSRAERMRVEARRLDGVNAGEEADSGKAGTAPV